jgi:hypothetical protein
MDSRGAISYRLVRGVIRHWECRDMPWLPSDWRHPPTDAKHPCHRPCGL